MIRAGFNSNGDHFSPETIASLATEGTKIVSIDSIVSARNPYSLAGEQVVAFAETVKPQIITPIHWMPDNNTYGDLEEIETIEQNMPETTTFSILSLN